ncbi:MAG: MFS transporter [Chrysiogenetes bacterium]|nr:MFS transporter [Chrysiogenetes bacterium]
MSAPTQSEHPLQQSAPFDFQAKSFALLLVANFAFFLSFSLYFLIPLYIKKLGGSESDIGQIMFAGGVATLISIPQVGSLIDRYGRKRFLILGALAMVVGNSGYLLVDRVGPMIYAVRVLQGASFAFAFTTAGTMAADFLDPARRSWGLGLFGVATLITHAIGPSAAEWIVDGWGFVPLFLTGTALALFSTIIATQLPEPAQAPVHPEHHGAPPPSYFTVMRRYNLTFATILNFTCGAGFGSIIMFLPTYVDILHLPKVSPFFVSYSLVAVFLRLTAGSLPDRYGKQRFIIPCAIGYVLCVAATSYLDSTFYLTMLGGALGVAHGMLYPVLNALVVDRVEGTGALGKGMGLYVGSFNAGVTMTSLSSGYLAESFGYPAMFRTSALVTAVGAALYIWNEVRVQRSARMTAAA